MYKWIAQIEYQGEVKSNGGKKKLTLLCPYFQVSFETICERCFQNSTPGKAAKSLVNHELRYQCCCKAAVCETPSFKVEAVAEQGGSTEKD